MYLIDWTPTGKPLWVKVDLGVMPMKRYSPDLQNWSLTIRCSNLLSFLLGCGTRPYEWGTQ